MTGLSATAGGRVRLAALLVGVVLLLVAWIAATAPFAAPDEADHYIHALNISQGQFLGPKVRYTGYPLTPQEEAWTNRNNRAVLVPAPLTPPNINCIQGHPDLAGSCFEDDDTGNYPPLSYLLPAAGIAVSHHTTTALWLARAANAVQSLAFLLLAIVLLWNGTGWSVLGLLAAVTPMVFFTSTVVNPSGLQITAGLAFTAAVLRITRDPPGAPRWTWVGLAVSGAAAILAGPIGLELAIMVLVLFAALLGRQGLEQLRAISGRWPVRIAALTLVTGAVLALVYSYVGGFGAPTFRISPIGEGLHQGLIVMKPVLKGAVGIFASLTIFLPLAAYWIWWLMVLGVVGGALWLGDRRQVLVTSLVTILALAFPLLFYAWVERFTGFPLQGREVIPALALIPLVAGEVVSRHSPALADRRFAQPALGGVIALIAAFQAYAWWHAAHSGAAASGTFWFFSHAAWSPPAGWFVWFLSAALGTVALLAFASSEGFAGLRFGLARDPARGDQLVV